MLQCGKYFRPKSVITRRALIDLVLKWLLKTPHCTVPPLNLPLDLSHEEETLKNANY